MATREQGLRRLAGATAALVTASVAGSVGFAVLARADTSSGTASASSTASTSSGTSSSSGTPSSSGTSSGTGSTSSGSSSSSGSSAPSVSSGSGDTHASSGGS